MSYLDFINVFPDYSLLKPLFDLNVVPYKTWEKGEIICHSNHILDSMYFFTSGRGQAYRPLSNGKNVIYAPYGAGDIAGDVEFIVDLKATGSMVSSNKLSGYRLYKSRITSDIYPDLYRIISEEVTQKLILSSVENAIRIGYSTEERIAYYCLYENDNIVFSMEELAGIIGTTYRHLSRVLKKFSDDGFINVENKKITVINNKELMNISKSIKDDFISVKPTKDL